jgi:hypothetical protein
MLLAGVMVGCFELFGNEGIRNITDLKGKSVGVQAALGSNPHALLTLLAAQVGLEPGKDLHWVTDPKVKPKELFEQGKIDAFLAFPPEPRSCAPAASGMSSSILLSIDPGRNISAACWPATGNSLPRTRSRPSASCGPSSRQRIYARLNRHAQRNGSPIVASRRTMTMPSRR